MNHKHALQLEIAQLTNSIIKYNKTCKKDSDEINFVLITLERNDAEGVIEADITHGGARSMLPVIVTATAQAASQLVDHYERLLKHEQDESIDHFLPLKTH